MKLKLPLIAAFVAVLGLTACGGSSSSSADLTLTNPASLVVTDTVFGTGAVAATGSSPTIKYTGWLYSKTATNFKGTQFDSGTINPIGTPPQFKLGATGANSLIAGFDQGVVGMKAGGKRTLLIPSSLAYGSSSPSAAIPANAGLVFEVEVTAVN